MPNDNGIYDMMGRVIDMCLVPNSEIAYILTKPPKSHEKIKYQFLYSLYDTREVSTKSCKQIVNEITQNIINCYLYLCFALL